MEISDTEIAAAKAEVLQAKDLAWNARNEAVYLRTRLNEALIRAQNAIDTATLARDNAQTAFTRLTAWEEEETPPPQPALGPIAIPPGFTGTPTLVEQWDSLSFAGPGASRINIHSNGPDGTQWQGETVIADTPSDVAQYKSPNPGLFSDPRPDAVAMQLDVFIPETWRASTNAPKMPIGIYGGAPNCAGLPQTGGQLNWDNAGGWSSRLYMMELDDQPGVVWLAHFKEPKNSGTGGTYSQLSSIPVPKGRQVTITLVDVLGTVGQTDGYAQVWFDNIKVIQHDGLMFSRDHNNWLPYGIVPACMWGGPIDGACKPKQNQTYYFRNWRLWALGNKAS